MDIYTIRQAALARLIENQFHGRAAAFAERVGMQASYVSRLLAPEDNKYRKRLGEEKAREIEAMLDLPAGYFDVGDAPADMGNIRSAPRRVKVWSEDEPLTADEVEVPRLSLKLSAGDGRLQWHIDEKGTPNRYRRAWVERHGYKPEHLVTVQADGDSMSPEIKNGSPVTVNTAETRIRSGKIYAIDYQGEFFIKRLFVEPDGSIRVVSDSTDKTRYPDWHIRPEHGDVLRILGRAVQVQNEL
ncbi:MAG: S24 family peptidase [Burkholderiales bacterium]|nr:S24 family peptidase [Burkholderiales bacterium]